MALNDSIPSVAENALFSLTAFGEKAIPGLLKVIRKDAPPYISEFYKGVFLTKKGNTGDRNIEEQLPSEENYYYSRSGMCALIALRILGDTVLYYIPKNSKILSYFKIYLLEGMDISHSNFDRYYKLVTETEADLDTMYYGSHFLVNMMFRKLTEQFSEDEAIYMIEEKKPLLKQAFLEFIKATSVKDDFSQPEKDFESQVLDPYPLNADTANRQDYSRINLYQQLNRIALRKDSFSYYRNKILDLLNSGHEDRMLFVLLANIGDSAKSIYPQLIQYIRNAKNGPKRYLAIKAAINTQLVSENCRISFHPDILTVYSPETFSDSVLYYDVNWRSYFNLTDELHEGRGLRLVQKIELKQSLAAFNAGTGIGKVYTDSLGNNLNKNSRVLKTNDINAMKEVLQFADDSNADTRLYCSYILGLADSLTDQVNWQLKKYLSESDPAITKTAVSSMLQLGTNERNINAFLTIYSLESYFTSSYSEEKDKLKYGLDILPLVYEKAGPPAVNLPMYPTPPPEPSINGVLTVKNENVIALTTGQVYNQLRTDLQANNTYELHSFRFMDGFAMQTRLERLNENGMIDLKNRYSRAKVKPQSIGNYFYILFCGDPGTYRGASFIACRSPKFERYGKKLINDKDYDQLFEKGIPGTLSEPAILSSPFTGKTLHLFIYEYKKDKDGIITLIDKNESHEIATQLKSLNLPSFKLE